MGPQLAMRLAGLAGASGVGIGAFGAHALKKLLEERGSVSTFQTGVQYRKSARISAASCGWWANCACNRHCRRLGSCCGVAGFGQQPKGEGAWHHVQAVCDRYCSVLWVAIRPGPGRTQDSGASNTDGWALLPRGVGKPRNQCISTAQRQTVQCRPSFKTSGHIQLYMGMHSQAL